jgi:phospholipid transport system transporter-binding protein
MFQPALTLTVDNANSTLEAGLCAIKNGQTEIDLAHLTTVDSAGVATLLAWQRAANARNQVLHFRNLPGGLRSLAELYGVFGLLDSEAAQPESDKVDV